MRMLAVFPLLLASFAILSRTQLRHRSGSSTIHWLSVPPSVYEVRRNSYRPVIPVLQDDTVFVLLFSIAREFAPAGSI